MNTASPSLKRAMEVCREASSDVVFAEYGDRVDIPSASHADQCAMYAIFWTARHIYYCVIGSADDTVICLERDPAQE